ncbi:MAG: endonuclease/exonuclease/phosphatase family protein [Spirochaetaceae bacterium]|jgi:endonuclease/exonuclease/phosphatase family metal-dependent hydrolase|nr:endonuclease/exonuclease/phosphatase family protein [Spirochaetaceae bacterium]
MLKIIKERRRLPILMALILTGTAAGCKDPEPAASLQAVTIGAWNVQALFDGDENGGEYREYSASSGWSGEKYSARMTALSRALAPVAPDILALIEVENGGVLEALAKDRLGDQGYHWTFFAGNPGAALGIGLLSRFPLTRTRAHSGGYQGKDIPRPILEAWVDAGGAPLVIFACHWKSKLGGDQETEAQRRSSAWIINRRIEEIRRENPGVPVIILGDLNENYDEFYRQAGAYISALLPDVPEAAELSGFTGDSRGKRADFLVISGEKPPRAAYFPPEVAAFYSPWAGELPEGAGSYSYKNAWETIDHFLLSEALFDGSGWEFEACQVLNREPFLNGKGYPDAYNPRTGIGLSDHLPLLLTLKKASPGTGTAEPPLSEGMW